MCRSLTLFKMADVGTDPASGLDNIVNPQKRKSDVDESEDASSNKMAKIESPVKGKISMSIGKKPGISMNIGGMKKQSVAPIKMSLSTQQAKIKETVVVQPKSHKVASVFNEDSESDEEEMPMEAKMRMRNVGRDTPTASGPNSFGKGNLGFCDRTKMIERELKKQMEELGEKAEKK